jgi:type I restriction enzyme S subunit
MGALTSRLLRKIPLEGVVGASGVICDGDWVESKDQDTMGDVRLIQLADVGVGSYLDKSRRYLRSATAARLRCTFLQPGDLLIARMPDPIGRACIFPGDAKKCVTVVDVCILRADPGIADPRYLLWALNSPKFQDGIQQFVKGTTRQRISRSNLQRLKIVLPSLADQRRIAAILDRADALRAKRQTALKKINSLKHAIFAEMFGYSTRPTLKLGSIAKRITKGESPNWQGFAYEEEGVRFITSEDVGWGKLEPKLPKYISIAFHDKLKRSQVADGDLLINLVGASIGRCCISTLGSIPTNVNQAVAVVTLDHDRAVPEFILYQLLTPHQQNILLGQIVEAARANISLTNLRELDLFLPPLKEQQEFKRRISRIQQTWSVALSSARALDALIASLQVRTFEGEL